LGREEVYTSLEEHEITHHFTAKHGISFLKTALARVAAYGVVWTLIGLCVDDEVSTRENG
jgi:hypothetical protein